MGRRATIFLSQPVTYSGSDRAPCPECGSVDKSHRTKHYDNDDYVRFRGADVPRGAGSCAEAGLMADRLALFSARAINALRGRHLR
jgi:hypothetical protein